MSTNTSSCAVRKRLFLVGCSRSGTTLLQSLIAAHPDVVSFPESHFFVRLQSTRWWMNGLGMASRMAREVMEEYFREIGAWDVYRSNVSSIMIRAQPVCDAFVSTLDDLARKRKATYWLEKTPRHVDYLHQIESFVPDVHVIHLLRRGEATIASLYQATNRYPEKWGGPVSIEECCCRWERDVTTSLCYRGRTNQSLVTYESVVTDTEDTLRMIFSDIGIKYDSSVIENYDTASKELIKSGEKWKDKTKEKIEKREKIKKFKKIFDEEEQKIISERVAPLNAAIQKLE